MDNSGLFNEILEKERVSTLFQPVVNLITGETIGFEAFARGPENTCLNSPSALLEAARQAGRLFELERLFKKDAARKLKAQPSGKLLFVNVAPELIGNSGMKDEIFGRFAKQSVIFEITGNPQKGKKDSRTETLKNYRDEGYRLAFDNIGAAFSVIYALLQVSPDYLKIDADVVRNIDRDIYRQSILKSLILLSGMVNTKLIAQGIETKEELKTLIRLGVYAGQGYLLGMPEEKMAEADGGIVERIRSFRRTAFRGPDHFLHEIGDICEPVAAFDENETCIRVKRYLEENKLEGICALSAEKKISGLVMKWQVESLLSRQNGFELYADRPVRDIVDRNCITVDCRTPIQAVAELVFGREREKTYDNIIVTENSAYKGIVTVIKLLKYSMQIERSLALDLNPLTALPGNQMIECHLNKAIESGKNVCVAYFDLNNFKIYNDLYGFERGDGIIRMTKNAICDTMAAYGEYEIFVGHVGGDDFVAVIDCPLDTVIRICERVIWNFDAGVLTFFNETERKNGTIYGRDRRNHPRSFPLTRVSVSGVYGNMSRFPNGGELAQYISGIKKTVKAAEKSAYLIEEIGSGRRYSNI